MKKRPKVKLRGKDHKVNSNPDLVKAITMSAQCLAASAAKLLDLSQSIQSVNPNMRPIKFNTKQQWQDEVENTVRFINGGLQEVLSLEGLPGVIREGFLHLGMI